MAQVLPENRHTLCVLFQFERNFSHSPAESMNFTDLGVLEGVVSSSERCSDRLRNVLNLAYSRTLTQGRAIVGRTKSRRSAKRRDVRARRLPAEMCAVLFQTVKMIIGSAEALAELADHWTLPFLAQVFVMRLATAHIH